MNPLLQCYYALGMEKQAARGRAADDLYDFISDAFAKRRQGIPIRRQISQWLTNSGDPVGGIAFDKLTHLPGNSDFARDIKAAQEQAERLRAARQSSTGTPLDKRRMTVNLNRLNKYIADRQALGSKANWLIGGTVGGSAVGAGLIHYLTHRGSGSSSGSRRYPEPADPGLPPGVRRVPAERRYPVPAAQPQSPPSYSPINSDLNGPAPQGYSDKERKMMRDMGVII